MGCCEVGDSGGLVARGICPGISRKTRIAPVTISGEFARGTMSFLIKARAPSTYPALKGGRAHVGAILAKVHASTISPTHSRASPPNKGANQCCLDFRR